jgi:hypothetical protein
MMMMMTVLWDVAPHSLVEIGRRFGSASPSIINETHYHGNIKSQLGKLARRSGREKNTVCARAVCNGNLVFTAVKRSGSDVNRVRTGIMNSVSKFFFLISCARHVKRKIVSYFEGKRGFFNLIQNHVTFQLLKNSKCKFIFQQSSTSLMAVLRILIESCCYHG